MNNKVNKQKLLSMFDNITVKKEEEPQIDLKKLIENAKIEENIEEIKEADEINKENVEETKKTINIDDNIKEIIKEIDEKSVNEIINELKEVFDVELNKNEKNKYVEVTKNGEIKEYKAVELKERLLFEFLKEMGINEEEAKKNEKVKKITLKWRTENINPVANAVINTYKKIHEIKETEKEETAITLMYKKEDIENEVFYNQIIKYIETKQKMLQGKDKAKRKLREIKEEIKLVKDEKKKDIEKEIKETEKEIESIELRIEKTDELMKKYVKTQKIEEKKILKDEKKDEKLKAVLKDSIKAKTVEELKPIKNTIKELNQEKKEEVLFDTIMELCDEIIQDIDKAINKIEELKEEINKLKFEKITNNTKNKKEFEKSPKNDTIQEKKEIEDGYNQKNKRKLR